MMTKTDQRAIYQICDKLCDDDLTAADVFDLGAQLRRLSGLTPSTAVRSAGYFTEPEMLLAQAIAGAQRCVMLAIDCLPGLARRQTAMRDFRRLNDASDCLELAKEILTAPES
jgi:hypothetical protein